MIKAFKAWLPFACIGAGTIFLVYAGLQQVLRQDANDPQVQMAEDAAAALKGGALPSALVPSGSVDMASSLSPWLTIADASGKVLASSGRLEGSAALPPAGTLTSASQQGEDRVTWQPRNGVRQAVVIVPYQGTSSGYAIAGRSLREVEARETKLAEMAALALVGVLVGSFLILLVTA